MRLLLNMKLLISILVGILMLIMMMGLLIGIRILRVRLGLRKLLGGSLIFI